MRTLESIIQTEDTFYSCHYDSKRKQFVLQRIGSSRLPVCALHEPLYAGDKLTLVDSCLVLKKGKRIALKTNPVMNVFEKSMTLLTQ
ncbi:MAG: hypothetical protein WC410_01530 [Candidatus Paceibacterota bacterium]|nr:hypothetical protein [Candidatus Paceibacterota bacterium]MDD5555535.1 hypothetical protein [Candidatus Paceibacterota bacterium]